MDFLNICFLFFSCHFFVAFSASGVKNTIKKGFKKGAYVEIFYQKK
jgi:hypothetical protein